MKDPKTTARKVLLDLAEDADRQQSNSASSLNDYEKAVEDTAASVQKAGELATLYRRLADEVNN